jgi:hypothetical protein
VVVRRASVTGDASRLGSLATMTSGARKTPSVAGSGWGERWRTTRA